MMKKEKEINVKLFRVVGDIAPLVMVDYVDKDAQEHSGLMLLDTGSEDNLFYCEMTDKIGELCKNKNQTSSFLSSTNAIVIGENVQSSFALGGRQFHEKFCLVENSHPGNNSGIPTIIGILGLKFMIKHHLVIDFSDFTLHTSHIDVSNLSATDYDFFFPINKGLKYYKIPVMPITQGNLMLTALIDTGADVNAISSSAFSENRFKGHLLEDTETVQGIEGKLEVDMAEIEFGLITLHGEKPEEITRTDTFVIIHHNILEPIKGVLLEDGKRPDPVEFIIGCPFMAKEGWTIDFGNMTIYRRTITDLYNDIY